jgi:hypothetical protein
MLYQQRLRRLAIHQLQAGSHRVLDTIKAISVLDDHPEEVKKSGVNPNKVRELAKLKDRLATNPRVADEDGGEEDGGEESMPEEGKVTDVKEKAPVEEEEGNFERIAPKEPKVAKHWAYDVDIKAIWKQLHAIVDGQEAAPSVVEDLVRKVLDEVGKIPKNLQAKNPSAFEDIITGFRKVEHDLNDMSNSDDIGGNAEMDWVQDLNDAYHKLCDFGDDAGVWVEAGSNGD